MGRGGGLTVLRSADTRKALPESMKPWMAGCSSARLLIDRLQSTTLSPSCNNCSAISKPIPVCAHDKRLSIAGSHVLTHMSCNRYSNFNCSGVDGLQRAQGLPLTYIWAHAIVKITMSWLASAGET